MNKILMMGSDSNELVRIERKIATLELGGKVFSTFKSRPGGVGSFNLKNIDIIIYDFNEINSYSHNSIQKLRELSFTGHIIVTAQLQKHIKLDDFHNMENVHFFEKPFIAAEFLGFFTKLINSHSIQKCRHKRYHSNQAATIESYYTNSKYNVTITNISKGGACIDGDLNNLNEGDFIRMHVNFDELQSERVLCAQVVWSKKKNSSKSEAGLKFVSSKKIYQHLIEHTAI